MRSGRRIFGSLAVTLAIVAAVVLAHPAPAAASLHSTIDKILARHGLLTPGTAVYVYDQTRGRRLYSRYLNKLLLPASNEKLVTSATALAKWNADYRFHTDLLLGTSAPDANGVLHASVYLKGYGDPSLSTGSFQKRTFGITTANIKHFVAALNDLGVKKITGRVIADDSYFDLARVVANWRPSMSQYCGPLSALTLNEGVGPNGKYVSDPSLRAAGKLTALLRDAGIAVTHAARRGATPSDATLCSSEKSARLSRILGAMNKPSDNFFAEELLKGLGAAFRSEGSTTAGLRVEKALMKSKSIKLPKGSFWLRDGSGLSYADRLSVHAIVKLLGAMSRRSDYAVYRQSLSVAGVDGTLRHRMKHTAAAGNVHAKTGTLAAASNLSGYVTSANHHKLVFSILMNASGIWVSNAHAAQDAIAVTLAKSRL